MKKVFLSTLCLLLTIGLPLSLTAQEKTIKLKLATVTPAKHAYNVGAREFARRIKEATGGAIDIRVFGRPTRKGGKGAS